MTWLAVDALNVRAPKQQPHSTRPALARRSTQGVWVALDIIHQLGNLLFGEQVECEVARQVGESESNARICQGACALACGGYVAGQCRLRDFAQGPF